MGFMTKLLLKKYGYHVIKKDGREYLTDGKVDIPWEGFKDAPISALKDILMQLKEVRDLVNNSIVEEGKTLYPIETLEQLILDAATKLNTLKEGALLRVIKDGDKYIQKTVELELKDTIEQAVELVRDHTFTDNEEVIFGFMNFKDSIIVYSYFLWEDLETSEAESILDLLRYTCTEVNKPSNIYLLLYSKAQEHYYCTTLYDEAECYAWKYKEDIKNILLNKVMDINIGEVLKVNLDEQTRRLYTKIEDSNMRTEEEIICVISEYCKKNEDTFIMAKLGENTYILVPWYAGYRNFLPKEKLYLDDLITQLKGKDTTISKIYVTSTNLASNVINVTILK